MTLHAPRDVGGNRAKVERCCTFFGNGAQHLGQGRIFQGVADRTWQALRVIEIAAGLRIAAQRLLSDEQLVQSRADRKAALSQFDRRLEQDRPGKSAMLAMGLGQHRHNTGCRDRKTTDDGLRHSQGLAISAQEHRRLDRSGSGLATIPGLHRAAVPMHQKCATTDATGLRLDQGQHHLHGDRRIERRAAGLQNLVASLDRQRIRRSHCKMFSRPAWLGGQTTGCFRLDQRLISIDVIQRQKNQQNKQARNSHRIGFRAGRTPMISGGRFN